MPAILEQELKTYEAHKEELLAVAEGQFALVTAVEIIGTYATQDEAISEGYSRFVDKSFLVKQILRVEPVHWYFASWTQ